MEVRQNEFCDICVHMCRVLACLSTLQKAETAMMN